MENTIRLVTKFSTVTTKSDPNAMVIMDYCHLLLIKKSSLLKKYLINIRNKSILENQWQ